MGSVDRFDVEAVLGAWDQASLIGQIERLPGLTNRTFRVSLGETVVVVRLPGVGTSAYIDRGAELDNATSASALGIGASILFAEHGAMITTFLEGRTLTPSILRDESTMVERAGRLLKQVHTASGDFSARFDPVTIIVAHRSGLTDISGATDLAIAQVLDLDRPTRLVPSHNDPWPENFLDSGDELHLLDWEYSAMNEPAWDLADLIVEADLDGAGRRCLLAAYSGADVDPALGDRVDQLCPVTDLLWGLWALIQERDGNEAEDFATYGHRRLDRAADSLH